MLIFIIGMLLFWRINVFCNKCYSSRVYKHCINTHARVRVNVNPNQETSLDPCQILRLSRSHYGFFLIILKRRIAWNPYCFEVIGNMWPTVD